MHAYIAYGLHIRSDIELPQLRPIGDAGGSPVAIREGEVPASGLDGADVAGPIMHAKAREIWLNIPDVARFHVRDGGSITYHRQSEVDEALLRTYLLGSGLGAILIQRGFTVLHGNAVAVDGGCLVCVGDSGVGKSTTSAGFFRRGHGILADDISPIDDESRVVSGMPHIKVWDSTAMALGISTAGLSQIAARQDKFLLPLGDSFVDQPLPLRALFELCPSEDASMHVEPMSSLEKIALVERNLYRPLFVHGLGMRGDAFRRAARQLSGVPAFRVHRSTTGFQLDKLLDLLLETYAEVADVNASSSPNT